jgi:enoyl-CoA hydratase/carnithine racemase
MPTLPGYRADLAGYRPLALGCRMLVDQRGPRLPFINADYSLYLGREPRGEHIGIQPYRHIGQDRLAIGQCAAHDLDGPSDSSASPRSRTAFHGQIRSRAYRPPPGGSQPEEAHMTVPAPRFVRCRQADGVATVELVNAKSMNILGSEAIEELTTQFRKLSREDDCRVVVLRGAGDKAFIGGADINEMAGLDQGSAEAFIGRLAVLCEAVRTCPAPVIARLSGWCLGAGLEVAVSCDLRVAGAGATFGMPEVAVGIPSVIHAALIPVMIGASRAAWLLLTGETIDADTAANWGLVHDVVPDDELDARITQLAARMAALGPEAVRRQKLLLNEWIDMTPRRAIEESIAQFGLAFLTGEPQHYMARFMERQAARRK